MIASSPYGKVVLNAMNGYNKIAPFYNSWHWSRFWKINERPLVSFWLNSIMAGTVLDAGCGTGRYFTDVQIRGHKYIGIDLSEHMLEIAVSQFYHVDADANVQFQSGDSQQLPLFSDSLSAILCTRTLSHIKDVRSAFQEFKRTLSSGGIAIITDVHAQHPYENTNVHLPGEVVAIETHKHEPAFLIETVKTLGGFEILKFGEYGLSDLAWKPFTEYKKLYKNPSLPVFYSLILRKL